MLLLKNNQIPKGLIPLERLFDQNDIHVKSSSVQPQLEEVEDCNIGSEEKPKFIKLSKYLPHEYKHRSTLICSKNMLMFLHGLMKTLKLMILVLYNIKFL
jgi:hypothetical protein